MPDTSMPSSGLGQNQYTLPIRAFRRSSSHRRQAHYDVHRRLPSLCSDRVPGTQDSDSPGSDATSIPDEVLGGSGEEHPDAVAQRERQANFLGRVDSYSRLMHAHTRFQLGGPTINTLPSYSRTMHAHTLNQLHAHGSDTETVTLAQAEPTALLSRQIPTTLARLHLEEPPAPNNTPVTGTVIVPGLSGTSSGLLGGLSGEWTQSGLDMGKLRKRSTTDPVPRDFAYAPSGSRQLSAE